MNKEVQFYWEYLGQHYEFDSNKKYLIYYPGCFCPPTKGHFNKITKFTHLPNANFFIHQGGREARHGVPYDLSRKIWRIYIKELLPSDRFALVGRRSHHDQIYDLVNHKYTREADTVVFIAGNENYNLRKMETFARQKKYHDIFRGLMKKGKEIVFLYLNRPSNGISATKLSKVVRKYKYCKDKQKKIRPYLPNGLSDKAVRYIISKLKKCNLK